MSKRFNQINEKCVDEFNEVEENQNTKRRKELDVLTKFNPFLHRK